MRSIVAEQAGLLGDVAGQAALQAAPSFVLRVAHMGLLGERDGQAAYLTRCAGSLLDQVLGLCARGLADWQCGPARAGSALTA